MIVCDSDVTTRDQTRPSVSRGHATICTVMLIFSDVKYFLSPSLPSKLQSQLHLVLDDNGATQVPLDKATHVVTNPSQFEGWETISKHVAVVTVCLGWLVSLTKLRF